MSTAAQVVACACGRRFQAPAQLRGRRVQCPACGQAIDIPAADESGFDLAAHSVQSLPAGNPLGSPVQAASPARGRVELPRGVWIALGLGGAGLVLMLVLLLGLRAIGQRLMAENRAKAAQRAATGPAAAPAAGPQVYQSPTGRFSVEFSDRPKRELVRSSERGGLAHWEAELMLGQFLQGRGERFLAIEQPIAKRLTEEKTEAVLAQLVNVTAHTDDGAGRILTTQDISQPGYRGREVTYEYTAKSGVRVSGRYRVLFTDREIISIEWVAAPAKPETPEVKRYFDSFKMSSAQ